MFLLVLHGGDGGGEVGEDVGCDDDDGGGKIVGKKGK